MHKKERKHKHSTLSQHALLADSPNTTPHHSVVFIGFLLRLKRFTCLAWQESHSKELCSTNSWKKTWNHLFTPQWNVHWAGAPCTCHVGKKVFHTLDRPSGSGPHTSSCGARVPDDAWTAFRSCHRTEAGQALVGPFLGCGCCLENTVTFTWRSVWQLWAWIFSFTQMRRFWKSVTWDLFPLWLVLFLFFVLFCFFVTIPSVLNWYLTVQAAKIPCIWRDVPPAATKTLLQKLAY